MKKWTYNGSYDIADRIKFLKQNYNAIPFFNRAGVKIGRFISTWGSGISSDTYALYFEIPNREFTECSIVIDNIWGTFAQHDELVLNDTRYEDKIKSEGGVLETFFRQLALLENSITFAISNDSHKIEGGYAYEKYPTDYAYILPTISNLRMRNSPALTGEVVGFMQNRMYQIIRIGERAEIDGITGNWILIKPYPGNSLSWVFSGYTRKATEQEIANYYDGS
jgi:hypothetical protein